MNDRHNEAALTDLQIEKALAAELDRVGPRRNLWPSIQAEVSRRQQKRRWRWLDFLGVLSFLGVVFGSPAPAVRLASVALGGVVMSLLLAWLLLSQPWMSNPDVDVFARHASDYWYGEAGYDAFFIREGVNPAVDTTHNNFCRFAVEVDTVSYAVAWQLVVDGRLPDPDSVRVEEFINHFAQGFEPPTDDPFAIQIEGAPSPFGGEGIWLIRVGLQGRLTNAGDSRVIARNVEAPVEFNPAVVSSYRQLGYEYRRFDQDDSSNDAMVAGEVIAGLAVTALYELQFHEGAEGRVATVHILNDDPDTGASDLELTRDIYTSDLSTALEQASPQFQRDVAVAEYAEILRDSYWARGSSLAEVRILAERVSASLPDERAVAEFLGLVTRAERIAARDS